MVFHMSFYKVDYECSSSESTFHTQDEFPGKSFSKEMIYSMPEKYGKNFRKFLNERFILNTINFRQNSHFLMKMSIK